MPATFQPLSVPAYMCGAHRATKSPMPLSNAPSACGWSMFLTVTSVDFTPRASSHAVRAKWAEETVVHRMVLPRTSSGRPNTPGYAGLKPLVLKTGLSGRASTATQADSSVPTPMTLVP